MLRFLRQLLLRPGTSDRGAAGEQLAADWLRTRRRFRIVARNWRSVRDRRDEIDLVACDGEVLVFVEVKTRAAGARVPGVYSVNARKRRALYRASATYLARLRRKPRTFRFDVVEVTLGAGEPQILHFENMPLFDKRFFG